MSVSVTRSLGLLGRAVQCRLSASLKPGRLSARPSRLQQPFGQMAGPGATRSVWYMTSQVNLNKQSHHPSVKCSCCGLHTQGDKEMADFLAEEIKVEKQNEKTKGDLPSVNGFKITKADTAEVEFQKQDGNELITVKFNVNHSVEDDFETEEQQQPEGQSQMMSKPAFIVEINKGGDQSLAIQCVFPPPDDMTQQQGEQQYDDEIEIQDVTFVNKNSDWEDKCYTVAGSIMDGNLYDMLLTMLEERGVDANFVEQLVEFSTSYEHKKYIDFLQKLKDFASQK